MRRPTITLPLVFISLAAVCLLAGTFDGLFVAPAEQHMGDVQGIMYVHVPTAWTAMLVLTCPFVCALMFLFNASWRWDNRLEAAIEVSVLFCLMLCIQGAIWAKPTWGVWWDWDPRLTTTAVLLTAFVGVMALRHFLDDPAKRATWPAVATVIAYVDVPIVYFSVKWWNSLHQRPSSASSISRDFLIPLMLNFAGMLLLVIGLTTIRARTAALRLEDEVLPPPLPAAIPMEVMA
jgi:ABC-type transport system involved in cytochrome c biogenesis, permease component